jgi:hypothetical protein
MIKRYLSLLIVCFLTHASFAQDFTFESATSEEINLKKYQLDTAAHAVVLNEYGNTRIDVVSDDNIKIIYEYHIRIKIFDSKSFDKGTIEIPFYSDGENSREMVEEIKGITTYKDENGQMKTAELEQPKILEVKQNRYWSSMKFAMPNVRAGCIIEYKYKIYTPFWDKLPNWKFQDDIPKMNSEYEMHIPAFWIYNGSLRGALPLTKNVSELERACFTSHGSSSDCSHFIYGMRDVPAFKEEDYMTAPKNFMSAMYFTLSEYTNPYNGVKKRVAKEWRDVDYNMKHADYFGSQIRKKDALKLSITPVLAGKVTPLEKARAVYTYIQKSIKWNGHNSRGSDDGIRKAIDNHTGNAADVNLALVNALNSAGVNAEAVLLSTRVNGLINKMYPIENDFNYVVARAIIEKDTFLLDATEPTLAFGMLPLRCLNDQGRVMSMEKPSYWVDLQSRQRKTSTTAFDLTLQSDGKLKGTIITYSSGYEGYEKRNAIKKFNTVDEYVENLDEHLAKIKILNWSISNLDSLDMPVTEKYEVEINAYDNLNHKRVAFNPFIFGRISNNPFKLAERNYPVDWGMPSDERFILTMHLPVDYVIENSPVETALSLPNKGGLFITSFTSQGENSFTFSNVIQFSKSIYAPEEYPYLKEIYNRIIAAQKAEIVFKKRS